MTAAGRDRASKSGVFCDVVFGVEGSTMKTDASSSETWEELRRLVGKAPARTRSPDFWEEMFGASDGLIYDGEGNDRTDLLRALVDRLDQTTRIAQSLAERVAVLERLAVQDEARIALEIEKLRKEG
jgi:hypothetical protein